MATSTGFGLRGKGRDSYLALIQEFPLASIRSEHHLKAAQQVIDRLLARGALDSGEATYLDALSDLVAAYEDKHHPIPPPPDAELLRHLIEAKGVTQLQLSRETGVARSSISEVLSGKKPLSRQMMRAFAGYFRVPIGVLAANL